MHSPVRLLATLLILLTGPLATAADINVTTLDDEVNSAGDCSLREAIQAANTNAAVDGCSAGESGEDDIEFSLSSSPTDPMITLVQGAMEITEDVRVLGFTGGGNVTISGANEHRIFEVTSGKLSVLGLILQNARAERGAAVYVASGASLRVSSVVRDNEATGSEATDGGAGIYNDGGTVEVDGSTFERNVASGASGSGGAIFNNGGALTTMSVTFQSNTATRAGGAIEAAGASSGTFRGTRFFENRAASNPGNGGAVHISGSGSSRITFSEASGNVAANEGGAFWNGSGTMAIDNTQIRGNEAQGDDPDSGGGGVFNSGGIVTLDFSFVSDNAASGARGSGGGLMSIGGSLIFDRSGVTENRANRAGGGIESVGASVLVSMSGVSDNVIPEATASPGNGGGIHASGGRVELNNATVSGNMATDGGGLWIDGELRALGSGVVRVEGNTARGNAATNGGGGIYVASGGNASLTGSQLADNQASGASGSGGGLFVASDAVALLDGATVSGNTANRAGAGIENAGGTVLMSGTAVLSNVIPAETANPGNGGGLHSGGGTVTIRGGEFRGNDATEGGGLWSNGTLVIEPSDDDGDETTISGNIARGAAATNGGGGIYVESGGEAFITGALVDGNVAAGASGSGGGVFVASGASLTMTGGDVAENEANRAGAGIENAGGTVRLSNVFVLLNVIQEDTAAPGNGGGLHSAGGTVTVVGGAFSGNEATEGGGLWTNGVLIIGDAEGEPVETFVGDNIARGDDATNGGGGIYAETGADVRIVDASITQNVASGASGSGGGVFVADESVVQLKRVTVSGNRANRAGAGIEVADDGMPSGKTALVLIDVMVSGNSIRDAAPGNGGGIHIGGAGAATVRGSTISGNDGPRRRRHLGGRSGRARHRALHRQRQYRDRGRRRHLRRWRRLQRRDHASGRDSYAEHRRRQRRRFALAKCRRRQLHVRQLHPRGQLRLGRFRLVHRQRRQRHRVHHGGEYHRRRRRRTDPSRSDARASGGQRWRDADAPPDGRQRGCQRRAEPVRGRSARLRPPRRPG